MAQDCVKAMDKDVIGLKERFARTLQEAKEKIQQENPAISGSGMSEDCWSRAPQLQEKLLYQNKEVKGKST